MLGLFLFGGEVLRGFGFTMVVGILVGTYSTIYIAGPLVVWWNEFSLRKQQPAAGAGGPLRRDRRHSGAALQGFESVNGNPRAPTPASKPGGSG